MTGIFSRVFETAEDRTGAALDRGEAGMDRVADQADHADRGDGTEHGARQDAEHDAAQAPQDQESRQEQASQSHDDGSDSHADSSAATEADVSVAFEFHNESELSWEDVNGDSHSWSRSTEAEFAQDVHADASLGSAADQADDLI